MPEMNAENIKLWLDEQRRFFEKGETLDPEFRIHQLQSLKASIREHESLIMQALEADLHKTGYEAFTNEIGVIYSDINLAVKNLKKWARPRKVSTPLTMLGSVSNIYPEPYGVVLIIGPFNYPVNLVLEPLIGAIAAGNCAIIKPSRLSPKTAEVIAQVIRSAFQPEYIRVVEAGRASGEALLQAHFDYIFFTGGIAAGKKIMAAAAHNLTPVTLELGGKSPCIVDESADLETAARKIVWGKFSNAGQTCVAPDYLAVHSSIRKKLIESLKKQIERFYGADPQKSPDFGRIINQEHTLRLSKLIEPARVVAGGIVDIKERYIAPTILDEVRWSDPVMEEEIFGPILPVLEYSDLEGLIRRIRPLPKPLALYVFSKKRETTQKLIKHISFGGGCINDVLVHLGNPALPFGGVGASGMGAYHGRYSFETFSHMKGVLQRNINISALTAYPPYTEKMLNMAKKFMK